MYVTNRGEELSPVADIRTHCNKIQGRRSVSSPQIVISQHDQHVTDRRTISQFNHSEENIFNNQEGQPQPSTSPGVFTFNENFDPSKPNTMVSEKSPIARYHRKRSDLSVITPSRIPIKQTYIVDKTPFNGICDEKEAYGDHNQTNSIEKKSHSKIPRPESAKKQMPPKQPKATTEYNLQNNCVSNQNHLVNSRKLLLKSQSTAGTEKQI